MTRRFAGVVVGVVVSVLLSAGPVWACDAPGPPTLESIVTGVRNDRPVQWGFGEQHIVGVHVVRVLARAPALIPVTSQRAGSAVVRSWGEQPLDPRGALHPPRTPYIPDLFIGRYGHLCGPPTQPPVGTEVLAVSFQDGEGDPRTVRVDLRAGAIGETLPVLNRLLGPAEVDQVDLGDRFAATAFAWSIVVATGLVLVALGAMCVRLRARRAEGANGQQQQFRPS